MFSWVAYGGIKKPIIDGQNSFVDVIVWSEKWIPIKSY